MMDWDVVLSYRITERITRTAAEAIRWPLELIAELLFHDEEVADERCR
jgi:hypothetical protein